MAEEGALMEKKRKRKRSKKRYAGCVAAGIVLLLIVAGVCWKVKTDTGNTAVPEEKSSSEEVNEKLTEEQIEIIESQEGVTVLEDGTIEVDVSGHFAE